MSIIWVHFHRAFSIGSVSLALSGKSNISLLAYIAKAILGSLADQRYPLSCCILCYCSDLTAQLIKCMLSRGYIWNFGLHLGAFLVV